MFLRNLLPGEVLAGAWLHGVEFSDGGLADGGVGGVVFQGELLDDVRAFEDDAAAGVFGGDFAKVLKKFRFGEDIVDAACVLHIFLRKLNDGAGFDGSAGTDVMGDARGHGTERLAFVVVVSIDQRDGQSGAHGGDELADANELIRAQSEFLGDVRADWPVGVIPSVVDAPGDKLPQPSFRQQVIDVRLAETGGDAGEEFLIEAISQATQGAGEYVLVSPPQIADAFGPLDANEWGDVAQLTQLPGHLLGNHLAVGEELEITVRMLREKIQQLRMQQRLAAEHTEEAVAMFAGIVDEPVEFIQRDHITRGGDIHPAALAAEITGVDDAQIEEGREYDASFQTLSEEHDAACALEAKIPRERSHQLGVHGA